MDTQRKKGFLLITISILFVVASVFVIKYFKSATHKKALSKLITNLENYKIQHSVYPKTLEGFSYAPEIKDFYYSVDSAATTFNLAYSEGVMDANNVTYNSSVKRWSKKFNY